jgi:hypothetical protein
VSFNECIGYRMYTQGDSFEKKGRQRQCMQDVGCRTRLKIDPLTKDVDKVECAVAKEMNQSTTCW